MIIAVPLMLNQKQSGGPDDYSGLPKLSVETGIQSFGFEGFLAFNVNELFSNNPWTENSNLTTMPVFTNPAQYDMAGKPTRGLSAEGMPGEEYIAHVELVYRSGRYEPVFMPYYRFLVELPTMQRERTA